jgi:hypothetical protein
MRATKVIRRPWLVFQTGMGDVGGFLDLSPNFRYIIEAMIWVLKNVIRKVIRTRSYKLYTRSLGGGGAL